MTIGRGRPSNLGPAVDAGWGNRTTGDVMGLLTAMLDLGWLWRRGSWALVVQINPLLVLVAVGVKLREAELDCGARTGDADLLLRSELKVSCRADPFSTVAATPGLLTMTEELTITCFSGLRLGEDGKTWPGMGFCQAPIVGPMVLVTEFDE